MKRVLLAGGTGLVGGAVLDLLDRDYLSIVCVGRRRTGKVGEAILTLTRTREPGIYRHENRATRELAARVS